LFAGIFKKLLLLQFKADIIGVLKTVKKKLIFWSAKEPLKNGLFK